MEEIFQYNCVAPVFVYNQSDIVLERERSKELYKERTKSGIIDFCLTVTVTMKVTKTMTATVTVTVTATNIKGQGQNSTNYSTNSFLIV